MPSAKTCTDQVRPRSWLTATAGRPPGPRCTPLTQSPADAGTATGETTLIGGWLANGAELASAGSTAISVQGSSGAADAAGAAGAAGGQSIQPPAGTCATALV